MKKLFPIFLLVFLFACKEDYTCVCTIYNETGHPQSTTEDYFTRIEKSAAKECEEKPSNFHSDSGNYMDCYLKER